MPVYPCLCVLMCLCVCFVPLVRPRDITIGGPSSFCVGICMFVCLCLCVIVCMCILERLCIFFCVMAFIVFSHSAYCDHHNGIILQPLSLPPPSLPPPPSEFLPLHIFIHSTSSSFSSPAFSFLYPRPSFPS